MSADSSDVHPKVVELLTRVKTSTTIPPKWLISPADQTLINMDYLTQTYKEARRMRYGQKKMADYNEPAELSHPETKQTQADNQRISPYVSEADKRIYHIPREVIQKFS
ncbi:hypothetical protein EG68_05729 [Paragonimus skrjabini miyazakii]|uniref:Uncharacterized protein n=1 Tax=Paragonimus skrjabini miyazakii TaxID=59628 RepID=A0A8S9YZ94_9TREM|nr:hypothetical protein EG68_05729 [Paragonimus skrjabini miyazakii]